MKKNIFDQLKEEHETVKSLLSEAELCPKEERVDVLERIEKELVPHARGEEKTLYAMVLKCAKEEGEQETAELANEAYEEHRAVDELLKDIKSCDPKDERWLAILQVMTENLEHHIEEEENELFPQAQDILSQEEQLQIFQSYIEAKEQFAKNLPTQSQISEREPTRELR